MKKRSFQSCQLYVIVDGAVLAGRDPAEVAEAAVRGGADAIQWRDKTASGPDFLKKARAIREAARLLGAVFIVNDRVEAALQAQADGVHVGHEDLPVRQVRSLVGESMLIGRSTHSLEEALEAERAGADYIGVGPVFRTPTKPDYKVVGTGLVKQIAVSRIQIPWVAIGGIDLQSLPLVLSAGAIGVAVVRAVAGASDPEKAAYAFKTHILDSETSRKAS